VQHHAAQALAIFAMLVAALLLSAGVWAFCSYLLVFHRTQYESLFVGEIADALGVGAAIAWLFLWIISLKRAIGGSTRRLFLVSRLAHSKRVLWLSRLGCACLYSGAILTAAVAIHAVSLTRVGGEPAHAYMLYDDMGVVPRWVFNLGFYRVALAANNRWGERSVVVAPLTRRSFADAIRYGDLVFVASHGFEGSLVYSGVPIEPVDELAEVVGPHLRRVYLTACDGGLQAAQWEKVLAPARVTTFARLSAVAEHIYWLWIDAPTEITEMPLVP
jgi:hypothetical protein